MLQANGQKRHLFFSRSFDKVALRTRKRAFEKYKRNFAVTLDRVIFLPLNLPFVYQRVVYKV